MRQLLNTNYLDNRKKLFPLVCDSDWDDFRWQWNHRITTEEELSALFPTVDQKRIRGVKEKFPFAITPYFLSLIASEDPLNDPIGKQVVPDRLELQREEKLCSDPFREQQQDRMLVPGLVKRYPDRVIVITTSLCPSFCRYCTRKWNWKEQFHLTNDHLEKIVVYLKQNPQVREVILSGGEPFLLDPAFLDAILKAISSVDTVEVIRIGTRILSFLPQKIEEATTVVLKKYFPLWIVTHFNHPNEITEETLKAVKKILSANCSLCNQSVLLKGVNDTVGVMKKLVHVLQSIMVKPYYIFHPDLIEGTSHFRGEIADGLEIMRQLRGYTGGMCVPYYVVDLPEGGKIPLLPNYVLSENQREFLFKNYKDEKFRYLK